MRFVLTSLCVALLITGAFPIVGLINNYQQTASVAWWKVLLGPLAWFVTDFSGKSGSGVIWSLVTVLCIGATIAEIRRDCILWRFASSIAIAVWFLLGLSVTLAWT